MSRQNKVNPGMYTQRGRLTQDDAARELAKQRAIGSEHTWQPVQRDAQPPLNSNAEGVGDDATVAEPEEPAQEKPARVTAKARPAGKARTRAKAKAPRTARKAVLARGAGNGSALLAAGRKQKKVAATAKRKR